MFVFDTTADMIDSKSILALKYIHDKDDTKNRRDQLEKQIKEGLKCLKYLENQMNLLKGDNDSFKSLLFDNEISPIDNERMHIYVENLKVAQEMYDIKKKQSTMTARESEHIELRNNEYQIEIDKCLKMIKEKQSTLNKLIKENSLYLEKEKRAQYIINNESKKWRLEDRVKSEELWPLTPRELYIETESRKHILNIIVDDLLKLSSLYKEIDIPLKIALENIGLKPKNDNHSKVPRITIKAPTSPSSNKSGASIRSTRRHRTSESDSISNSNSSRISSKTINFGKN